MDRVVIVYTRFTGTGAGGEGGRVMGDGKSLFKAGGDGEGEGE